MSETPGVSLWPRRRTRPSVWAAYLVGGLMVIVILAIALPYLVMVGVSQFAQLFSRSEYQDVET